jgi:hypothetical protein
MERNKTMERRYLKELNVNSDWLTLKTDEMGRLTPAVKGELTIL